MIHVHISKDARFNIGDAMTAAKAPIDHVLFQKLYDEKYIHRDWDGSVYLSQAIKKYSHP